MRVTTAEVAKVPWWGLAVMLAFAVSFGAVAVARGARMTFVANRRVGCPSASRSRFRVRGAPCAAGSPAVGRGKIVSCPLRRLTGATASSSAKRPATSTRRRPAGCRTCRGIRSAVSATCSPTSTSASSGPSSRTSSTTTCRCWCVLSMGTVSGRPPHPSPAGPPNQVLAPTGRRSRTPARPDPRPIQ